jgi:hypothetical protein
MLPLSESVHSRLIGFSILSVVIITLSAIWRITYLKRFFLKKKLI